jgi:hypothetical protein
MARATLRSLHLYLRLIENTSELKRKMPTSSNPRTMKDGMFEMSRLVGIDPAAFKDPQNIAALVGAQRFVMIWGEPSLTDHVARVFDSSRVLLTVLIDPKHFENVAPGQMGPTSGTAHQQTTASAGASTGWAHSKQEPPGTHASSNPELEPPLDSLKALLSGNTTLICRLFRALFEHMLGFASSSSAQQGNVLLVSELTGSREHSRSFLSTAMFILGAEVDRDNLLSFMMEQGLFGMSIFEHMLQNRDYCDGFYAFRRLERAFMGPPAAEEALLRNRLDRFNAQFGGKPYGAKLFEADEQDKAKIDAYLGATDLLEAMALTPWCISLNKAVSVAGSYSIRSVATLANHFERFAHGETTKEQTNKEIADHLLAFARQFSADSKPA